jgi:hypothetical protein
VQGRRDGYYVLYSLEPDRSAGLSDAVLLFLADESARRGVA